jgi:hypothetical protein
MAYLFLIILEHRNRKTEEAFPVVQGKASLSGSAGK